MNFLHIVEGWYKSKIHSNEESTGLSKDRLKICIKCPEAVEKEFLKIINGSGINEKTKACKICGCPIFEKSLVKNEKCDLNKWNK